MVVFHIVMPFIVDLPMKNGGSFHSFLYVYQAGYIFIGFDKLQPLSRISEYPPKGRPGPQPLERALGVPKGALPGDPWCRLENGQNMTEPSKKKNRRQPFWYGSIPMKIPFLGGYSHPF